MRARSQSWHLILLIVVGFVVRLVFIGNQGFQTDVTTFELWARALHEHGLQQFYASAGFADYPPGYLYILLLLGTLHDGVLHNHNLDSLFLIIVKLPAILADLAIGVLLYSIVRRFAGVAVALGSAALYVLNPAAIFISSAWGQVDSVAGALALLAMYCLLRSDEYASHRLYLWIVAAWLSFASSVLIKPQAAVLLPLLIAFAFVDPGRRRVRIVSTGIGIIASLALALLLVEPFHPSHPIAAFAWLLQRYAFGSNVYPYNTVNAFNLWAVRGSFWQPDSTPILFIPQYVWGIVLVLAALALIVWRYVQEPTPPALLESGAIATIAFFVLSTRMHERYLFNGLVFTIACIPFARRYLWGVLLLSGVLFANLSYGMQYYNVVTNHISVANQQNLWGALTSLFALATVGTFFWLGYQFLGGTPAGIGVTSDKPAENATFFVRVRNWFDPKEGLAALRAPLDYLVMSALGLGSFILSFWDYWKPGGNSCWTLEGVTRCGIFDEVYFARAGEEYLQNLRIYENTHPPLSKLLVTLSMMLFGGMPHGHGFGGWVGLNALVGHMGNGDNPYGWRFLDVVFGALVVMVLFALAKRVTGSTLFATVAALLLVFDGMHFVQSRVATPEGFVVFFATFAVYTFYRFWISAQVTARPYVILPPWGIPAGIGASVACGTVIALIVSVTCRLEPASAVVVALYISGGLYLVVRYVFFVRLFGTDAFERTYAEGSHAIQGPGGSALYAADGGSIDVRGKIVRGSHSQNKGGALVYSDDALEIEYRRDASVTYKAPAGTATYANDEVHTDRSIERGRAANLWLLLFGVTLGCLVSSKWYGVMGFGVSFVVLIAVWIQPHLMKLRPALWGNPRGFRLDGVLTAIIFVSMTVYALAWLPDLLRHSTDPNEIHTINDVVTRQVTMFQYHDTLRATHPYASKWWEWPLDYVPVAYYYEDRRQDKEDPKGCCVYEVTSMPNPIILWFGLASIPLVAILAWLERNKGYALIVLTYLLQWLPWMESPRITFEYHYYVDIPLTCLCNAIILQRIWTWSRRRDARTIHWLGRVAVAFYVAATAAAFVFFYPILSGHGLSSDAWNQRMWTRTWVIGPG